MTEALAKQYLTEYRAKTNPLFQEFFRAKTKDAIAIGKIPAQLIRRFAKTALKGKRVRGALITLGYEIAGGKEKKAILDASLFIELFHTGLLIHDDLMDQDALRRGLPTIHKEFEKIAKKIGIRSDSAHFGESMAISAADLAFFLSWEKLMGANFPPGRIIKAGEIFTSYAVRVTYGQALDISTQLEAEEDEVLHTYMLKTAEYSGSLPLLLGATLAGLKDVKRMKALEEYGRSLGWAFQIQDDLLGMFGRKEEFGKPIGSDLQEGKMTLLMLHLKKKGDKRQRAFQSKILGKRDITKPEIEKMQTILKKSGSYQHVTNRGWEYVERGRKLIPAVTKDKKLRKILESLIVFTMERVS